MYWNRKTIQAYSSLALQVQNFSEKLQTSAQGGRKNNLCPFKYMDWEWIQHNC